MTAGASIELKPNAASAQAAPETATTTTPIATAGNTTAERRTCFERVAAFAPKTIELVDASTPPPLKKVPIAKAFFALLVFYVSLLALYCALFWCETRSASRAAWRRDSTRLLRPREPPPSSRECASPRPHVASRQGDPPPPPDKDKPAACRNGRHRRRRRRCRRRCRRREEAEPKWRLMTLPRAAEDVAQWC